MHPTFKFLGTRGRFVPPADPSSLAAWVFPDGSAVVATGRTESRREYAPAGTHLMTFVSVRLPSGRYLIDRVEDDTPRVEFQSVEAALVYMASQGIGPFAPKGVPQ